MMKTVVLLSGGLDSAVALAMHLDHVDAWADPVYTLTVNYGQRHSREVYAAQDIANYYGAHNVEVPLPHGLFAGSSLTDVAELPLGHADEPDSTFVPGRNTVLIAVAVAYAESIGAGNIVIGVNADDAGGYPDCRREFIESYRDTIGVGTAGKVWLHAPLLSMTKADIVAEAKRLEVPVDLTWSCYRGGEVACGKCGACVSLLNAYVSS